MSYRLGLLLCVRLILQVSGCNRAKPRTPIAPSKPWSIKLPNGWERQENTMGVALIGRAPVDGPGDTFAENVNLQVFPLDTPVSLKAFSAQHFNLAQAQAALAEFRLLETKDVALGKQTARRLHYVHTFQGKKLQVLAYLLVTEREGYVITCSAAHESFDRYLKQFEEICGSFEPAS